MCLSNIRFSIKKYFRVSRDLHHEELDWQLDSYYDYPSKLNETQPWRANYLSDGLSVDIETDKFDFYEDTNLFQMFNGFLVLIHDPNELPLQQGNHFFQPEEGYTSIRIAVEINLIDDDLKTMSVDKRNCFLEGERELEYFKIYTKNNCEHECLGLMILEECFCVPFFMISKWI